MQDVRAALEKIESEALNRLSQVRGQEELKRLKAECLGRKGRLTLIVKGLGRLPLEERPIVGELANRVKLKLEEQFLLSEKNIRDDIKGKRLATERVDVTLPGRRMAPGRRHPINLIGGQIIDIFIRLGFQVVEGPEVELDYYNFEALNIPKDHPARDMQDTFYLSDTVLLRTHTSPVQIRVMQSQPPPLRVVAPGKVYRCDSDVSHTPMFHQVEGFMIDEGVSFADLKGILTLFVKDMFGPDTVVRFRPSFFPFTEPSAEVDIRCVICSGKGCRVCSGSGWLEILGSGMVHPEVFREVGYDADVVTGFAFGMGVERIAMLKFGIEDIRLFFENDVRFLGQFWELR
jgi:phenylalanyl-tRNA synthetase alpha chain